MSSDIAIHVENVSKCFKIYEHPQDRLKQSLWCGKKQLYREFWALKEISLQVKKGETIGVIGRNGSGKSTLLQIIAGTLLQTDGEVQVHGRVAALLELGSGFNPDFTGRENIYMNGAILGLSKKEIETLFDNIVDFADIGDFIDQPVKTYSSGMAVRLAFAVQVMVPKEILIVDEALAVGDELFQRKCFAKIEEFKKQGGTILFVSHSGGAIVQLCDRAMLLDSGESLILGPSKKVVNIYQKLIYAPSVKREMIREEIKQLSGAFSNEKKNNFTSAVVNQVTTNENTRNSESNEQEMFDSNLVPKETMNYESNGATIIEPEIITMSGKRVNLLICGEKYIWRYKVRFDKQCQNVQFGMLIRTINGMDLGGAITSSPGNGIPIIEAGETRRVEFSFTPKLNAGTYFINGGVLGITEEGSHTYLARGIDLAAFKILHKKNTLMTSVVDFNVESEVYNLSS